MKKCTIKLTTSLVVACFYSVSFIIDKYTTNKILTIDFLAAIGGIVLISIFLFRLPIKHYLLIVFFLINAQYFGMMLNFYDLISIWDIILHFSSGIILVSLGNLLYKFIIRKTENLNVPIFLPVVFCVLFSVSCAAIWEIYEFTVDCLFGLTSQCNGIKDTMGDIIAGTAGAILGSIIYLMSLTRSTK